MRVLCVEHCPASLSALQGKLENAGYEVIPAANGQQAVSLFAAQAVDGVLLEYDLPDRTGTSVREEMKRIKPEIPVLLFSGLGPQTRMLLRFFDAYLRHEGLRESDLDYLEPGA
ncbi:MAG: response regulator [Terriglobales bacterium]